VNVGVGPSAVWFQKIEDWYVAGGGGLANVVEDTSPQLGGMLDVNGNALGDGTLELLKFVETGSAVNELTITNAAAGNAPILSATGDDANIGLTLSAKGTGNLTLGNFVFDGDQTVGAGQDNYILTYDDGTGLISLEAAAGGGGGGDVTKVGTPVDNQLGVWTGDGTIEGDANLTWDGSTLTVANTTDSASVNIANFVNDSPTPAAGDAAYIDFKLADSAGDPQPFGRMTWTGTTVAAGSEDGTLTFSVPVAGVLKNLINASASGTYDAKVEIGYSGFSMGASDFGPFINGFDISAGQPTFNLVRALTTHALMGAGVNGDKHRRFLISADGSLSWGSGSGARDVTLYRDAANVLKTDDQFFINGSVDQIQCLIQGHSVQSTAPNILVVEKSDGTDLFTVSQTFSSFQNPTDADSNQIVQFHGGNRATPAVTDRPYNSYFVDNSAGTQSEAARTSWGFTDQVEASKDGLLKISVPVAAVMTDIATFSSAGVALPTITTVSNPLALGASAYLTSTDGTFVFTRNTGNGTGKFWVVPSGTQDEASIFLKGANDSETTNYNRFEARQDGKVTRLINEELGTGSAAGTREIRIQMGGTACLVCDASGSVFGGDVNPDGDGTRDLGTQTTAQWANVWSDLINGAEISLENRWRIMESELYDGYSEGFAVGHSELWETGKSIYHAASDSEKRAYLKGQRPTFAVTEDWIEYKGRRLTAEMLDRLLAIAESN
jgi:hypothetical protein